MEQNSTFELSDPLGIVAAALEAAEQMATPAARKPQNPFRLRPATQADVSLLEGVEREAFPSLYPPTRFAREVARTNAAYLVAVRDWTEEELGQEAEDLRPGGDGRQPGGVVGHVQNLMSKLVFDRLGRRETLPPEYLAGLVGLWFVLDESHIVIIGSRPRDRRKGIGEMLLIGGIEQAIRRGSRVITLEVRESNEAARALYRKYGFREVGLRKRYYADNGEDAVIMTTPPIQSDAYSEQFRSLVRSHAERWGESGRKLPNQDLSPVSN